MSCSDRAQKPCQFRSPRQQLLNFNPNTETKSFPALTQKTVNFDPVHNIQDNFDPHAKTKEISIRQVPFGLNPEMMSISIRTLNSSQFQCPDTKKQLRIDADTKSEPFSALT